MSVENVDGEACVAATCNGFLDTGIVASGGGEYLLPVPCDQGHLAQDYEGIEDYKSVAEHFSKRPGGGGGSVARLWPGEGVAVLGAYLCNGVLGEPDRVADLGFGVSRASEGQDFFNDGGGVDDLVARHNG